MVLDNLENSSINIKNLTIPETQKRNDAPFSLDLDISQKRWGELRTFLDTWRETFISTQVNGSMRWFDWESPLQLPAAKYLAILFPDEKQKLIVESEKPNIPFILQGQKETDVANYSNLAASIKIGWETSSEELGITNTDLELLRNLRNLNTARPLPYLRLAANIAILFPNINQDPLPKTVESKLEEDIQDELSNDKSFGVSWFPESLSNLAIAYPQHLDMYRNNPKIWEIMNRDFKDSLQPYSFTAVAAQMKLILAKTIRITDKEIELDMPKPLETRNTPQIPEKRKF